MKRFILALLIALIPTTSFAAIANLEEEDGSPSFYPWKLKVTNGTLTDNADGTASLQTGLASSPAGNNQDVQFNNSGSFGADSGFSYNSSTDTLTAVNTTFTTIEAVRIGGVTPGDATFDNIQAINIGNHTAPDGTFSSIIASSGGVNVLNTVLISDGDASFSALAVNTDTLYVNPGTGNIGVGTISPDFVFDLKTDLAGNTVSYSTTHFSSEGVVVTYNHDSASPAASDTVGAFKFNGNDSGSNNLEYASISAVITDPTNGSEDGKLVFGIADAGSVVTPLTLSTTEIVLNEDQSNLDIRMESNTLDNVFFLDGSTGNIGIGTNAPGAKLEVSSGIIATDLDVTHIGRTTAGDATFVDVTVTSLGAGSDVCTDANSKLSTSGCAAKPFTKSGTVVYPTTSSGTVDSIIVGASSEVASDIYLGVAGDATFNNMASSVDFTIKSNTYNNMFYVDGSEDKIGINEPAPNSTVQITGSLSLNIADTIVMDYTVLDTDYTLPCDATTGDVNFDLPAASGREGRIYIIKKIDSGANNCTIDPNASETVDGSTTMSFNTQWHFRVIQSNGTNWIVIGQN